MKSTRREFLQLALAAGAAPAILRSAAAAQRRPLGVALVGLGSLSTNQIAPALQKTRNCRLAGIVTGTPAKAAEWRQKYGLSERSVYSYDTMQRMADNPEIDLVYVVTPNALHADHAIAAARAGKHVFCEKPIEVSLARAQAMIDACRQANRKLGIAYRCRFEPHHLECQRLARDNVFGPMRIIQAAFGFRAGNPEQWRLRHALSGGGALMDVGIYTLQTARMLTGQEPLRVTAVEAKTDARKFSEVDETMTFQLTFPNDVIANCSTTFNASGLNGFTVSCERGSFGMQPAYNYGGNRGWRSDNTPLQFPATDMFAAQLDDFADCIMTGRPSIVPGEEGLRDLRIVLAIYEAARTGRSVTLAGV